ncbi:MAG TPA: DUF4148 domain-containing protein [Paraburkholderia sp.]|jgi:hypothetical protein|nr:DUF4148 domain-containing protein [Paraburkholderia sp.]
MKSLIKAVVIAALVTAPLAAFAQSNQPLTRAQVRAELVQVEKAGYNPSDWIHYPENIQAAEARVAAEKGAAQADASGYGSSADSTSQAGHRADAQ